MKQIACGVVSCWLLVSVTFAQMPGGAPSDPCAALEKFFPRDTAFTATANVVTTTKKKSPTSTLTISFAAAGGNLRYEMDLTKIDGLLASDVDGMKQMGMDKLVILKLADKQAAYFVYPNLQSYCDLPAARKENPAGQVTRKELGKDMVANHPCTKSKLTFTDQDDQTSEALVWEAVGMEDFPVQYQTVAAGLTTTLTFTDIKRAQPAAALFELPASYKRYGSLQEIMLGHRQRMIQFQ